MSFVIFLSCLHRGYVEHFPLMQCRKKASLLFSAKGFKLITKLFFFCFPSFPLFSWKSHSVALISSIEIINVKSSLLLSSSLRFENYTNQLSLGVLWSAEKKARMQSVIINNNRQEKFIFHVKMERTSAFECNIMHAFNVRGDKAFENFQTQMLILILSLWHKNFHFFIGKVLPLVTFVKWNSGACSAPSGETGSCLHANECQSRGGIAGGQCAGGEFIILFVSSM